LLVYFSAPATTEKVTELVGKVVIERQDVASVARAFLIANGLLLPFLALQMYFHPLIWIASLWAVTFPGSTVALAMLFHRAGAGAPAVNGLASSAPLDPPASAQRARAVLADRDERAGYDVAVH